MLIVFIKQKFTLKSQIIQFYKKKDATMLRTFKFENCIYCILLANTFYKNYCNAFSQYHSQILISYQAKTHKYFRNNTNKKNFKQKM
ncbi:hypothetical protein RFI_38678 [Reticulomyxa filosa]|uniref:Uncharacterized protein n=1 Tax=Reticulomyxa filosa TaxID=46433 RepID=X6LDJ6_RETFI|nr:hypothetical protein RFI_38678 [Reticulomyxa filosa]|eukprot:ETN98809.1 hypothetical protein RFI_38678 [Reticulomyxa filosa]